MGRDYTGTTATGDNLDRLLGLLEAARVEEAARKLVDLRTAVRALLVAIEHGDSAERAVWGAAA